MLRNQASNRQTGMIPTILVVDDDQQIRDYLEESFLNEGYEVCPVGTGAAAIASLEQAAPDLVLLDLMLPDMSGVQVLGVVKEKFPGLPVVIITAYRETDTAVLAMKLNAFDYVNKPIQLDRLLKVTRKALSDSRQRPADQQGTSPANVALGKDVVPSRSPILKEIYTIVGKISRGHSSTVLIQGESGVGKDVMANLIHRSSSRREAPFLEINCAGLSENLLESELFGHEKGAFTDAVSQKMGLLELGHSGTVFLDEIGEMSLPVQVKLLRVLEKMVFRRVGGVQDIKVDVRIIAATNKDLAEQVKIGAFREDLYYRLKVVQLKLPPLRARPEDVLPLAEYFTGLFNERFGKNFEEISPAAKQALLEYHWPGNIRELKNLMERTVLLEDGPILEKRHLVLAGEETLSQGLPATIGALLDKPFPPDGIDLEGLIRQLEEDFVRKALDASHGNQSRAARMLGLNRDKLRYRMRQYRMTQERDET